MLFKCPIYETERATLLIYIQDNCKNFEHLSPNNKLIWLLSSEDTDDAQETGASLLDVHTAKISIKIFQY